MTMTYKPTAFGHRLRTLRTDQGWSLAQVSRRVNITQGALSLLERGHRNPSAYLLAQLADLYQWSMDDLWFGVRTRR